MSRTIPSYFSLPDFVGTCPYQLRANPHEKEVARLSERWLLRDAHFNFPKKRAFKGLKGAQLASQCYPDADAFHLRVCADYINYLFSLDDWLDEIDERDTSSMEKLCIDPMRDPHACRAEKMASKLTKSFFIRFSQYAGLRCQQRFITTMELFFKAVYQQARDRRTGAVPTLNEYTEMRRNTSGCKPCFALIEFAGGFELPDHVAQHPSIQAMEEATNDFVTWSNDVFSYNKEQCMGDKHNMIAVLMDHEGLSLQQAVDVVGDYTIRSIDRFEAERLNVPSFGPGIDECVQKYIAGMESSRLSLGSLHWSYETERYFGRGGRKIKRQRSIQLLPKEQ